MAGLEHVKGLHPAAHGTSTTMPSSKREASCRLGMSAKDEAEVVFGELRSPQAGVVAADEVNS